MYATWFARLLHLHCCTDNNSGQKRLDDVPAKLAVDSVSPGYGAELFWVKVELLHLQGFAELVD